MTRNLMVGATIWKYTDIQGDNPDSDIWSCVNAKTFEGSPNVKSTYNLNPSTYSVNGREGKAAALKTVGWDNYWGNTTDIIRHIAAGKLFIGEYRFQHRDGPETYNYGMSYVSRPTSLSAFYTYAPYNGDSFKAWIVLENRSEDGIITQLGYGEFISSDVQSNFVEMLIPINYTNPCLDITHMYVVFSSSANCSETESVETTNLAGMVSEGDYHNGSVLVIDDISLVYDK